MSALTILRAASRDVSNERYVEVMEAIDALADVVAALEAAVECGMVPTSSAKEGGANRFSRQVAVADQIRSALARCGEPA